MIEGKDKLEGSRQMATFRYQSGVRDNVRELCKIWCLPGVHWTFTYDTKRLTRSQQVGGMIITTIFKRVKVLCELWSVSIIQKITSDANHLFWKPVMENALKKTTLIISGDAFRMCMAWHADQRHVFLYWHTL